jgi:hypothetical protein
MPGRTSLALVVELISLTFAGAAAPAADDAPVRPLEQSFKLLDASGQIHALEPEVREGVRVFVFLTGKCPVCEAYIPELNRLAEVWSREVSSPVVLRGVWADATATPAQIARFVKDQGITFPILVDREGELARRLHPAHVPEGFVLDVTGRIAYRGRIDDTFVEIGRRRPQAAQKDLAGAVTAVLHGKPVATPRTEPVGCRYDVFAGPRGNPESVNYARHVAPIIYANCTICHREGEVGPFPLASFGDAARRAEQIARVTQSRLMPPWMPAETHGEFEGQRTLTPRQMETLRVWADGDRTEGDAADLPPAPQFVSGWRLGEPDLVLEMPAAFELRADGPDIYQNFVIPVEIPHDKLVAAVDFVPGNPRIVHHSLLFLDILGQARRLDAKTPEPGYASFGDPGFLPSGGIGGWSLGKTPMRLPNGLGRYLKKGSDIVMQIHYHPSGKRETDRSKVGVYFADSRQKVAADIWAATFSHNIPAGEKEYRVTARYVVPSDVELLGIVPHMHLIGRSIKAAAAFPDGTTRPLIDIPRWDFNWQDDYRFARTFKLPKGTRLEVEAIYDNSADNPANPSHPPQTVTWGEETTNEMLYCFFLVTADNPRDLMPMLADVVTREMIGRNSVPKKKK